MRTRYCKKGHKFDVENTRWNKHGKRSCRLCESIRKKTQRELIPEEERKRIDRERVALWRNKNREHANRLWADLRRKKKEWINEYKQGKSCIKCGESRIACLDFHHRDPEAKEFTISLAVARASLNRIQTEIAKCDIICSNCHRCLHAEEREKELI